MDRTDRGHRSLPHTADVILEAWGPDLPSCVEEAAAALVDTYVAGGDVRAVGERRSRLAAGSAEALLVAVLEEVIFTLDTADAVPVRALVRPGADGGFDLLLCLAGADRLETTGAVPKAVSRSGLEVRADPGGVRCRFLVDL